MRSSSFKEVIRLQFNALMMITIKGTLKQKRNLLARRFKQKLLFCEMGEAKLNEKGNVDKNSCDVTTFLVLLNFLQKKEEALIILFFHSQMTTAIKPHIKLNRRCESFSVNT